MLNFVKSFFGVKDEKDVFYVGKQRFVVADDSLISEIHDGGMSYINIVKVNPQKKEVYIDNYIKTHLSKIHTVSTLKLQISDNLADIKKRLDFKSSNDGSMEFLHVSNNQQLSPRLFSIDGKTYIPLSREGETEEEKEDIVNEKEELKFSPFVSTDYPIEIIVVYVILGSVGSSAFYDYLQSKKDNGNKEEEFYEEMVEFIDKFWAVVSNRK